MRTLTLALLAFAAAGCVSDGSSDPAPSEPAADGIPFDIEGRLAFVRGADTLRVIDVEIADTDSTRARGLMQRTTIPDDTGMLFVFPRAEPQAFYMMNTPRSLDIQFYGADSTLLNVAESTTPFSLDNVYSDGDAQFVVEVPAGYSRATGLVAGDRITWVEFP